MKIYLAGAITSASPGTLEWYELLARRLWERGRSKVFVPHKDGEQGPGCFRRDLQELATSDLVVADLTEPSLGTGCELILAPCPVFGVHRALAPVGGRLSPFIAGLFEARGWHLHETGDSPEDVDDVVDWVGRYIGRLGLAA